MGIHNFRTWLRNTYRNNTKVNVGGIPSNIGCLFFDMNGIFHNAAQVVYGYGPKGDPKDREFKREHSVFEIKKQVQRLEKYKSLSDEQLEEKHLRKIIKEIDRIVRKIRPQDYVVLAVDGVAPMAKITQQRKRRYTTRISSAPDSEHPEEIYKPMRNFSSNCITPGTEFMFKLDAYIQTYIKANIKNNYFKFGNMVYSNHLVPGEGEHKIFDMVRNGSIVADLSKNHIVYGMDADLIMLSALSTVPNIHLCRENFEDVISIPELRRDILYKMSPEALIAPEIVIQDFVIMIYFLGNDFLPHVVSLDDISLNIQDMIMIYNRLQEPLSDATGQILWFNFTKFLLDLSSLEKGYLKHIAKEDFGAHPFVTLDKARIDGGDDIDMKKFSRNWYKKALTPKNKEYFDKLGTAGSEVKDEQIQEMCLEYFKGIQWALRYYLRGHRTVSSKFIYVYFYAPLLTDLHRILETVDLERLPTISDVKHNLEDPYITPIHQLMCVMPRKSWRFIPQPYRDLMDIRFADLCPSSYEIDMEGVKKEYMATILINIVDPYRITQGIEDYPIPPKYSEQRTIYTGVVYNPRAPRAITTLDELFKYYQKLEGEGVNIVTTSLTPKPEEDLPMVRFGDSNFATIEPKSEKQMERIVEVRAKRFAERRKKDKGEVLVWTDVNIM